MSRKIKQLVCARSRTMMRRQVGYRVEKRAKSSEVVPLDSAVLPWKCLRKEDKRMCVTLWEVPDLPCLVVEQL